jgi:UDP-N-acetylglucosamine--N-acetylmuramyl-(pentapeptide) pyrophosphoryl-undecaprenol N-acetylglucosamine transferase
MRVKKARIAFYGINGTGLGHYSRLLGIAREARELLHATGVGADFRFLTTSEAPQVAWDFPVWKLPSKTVVAGMDTDNADYAATSQLLVCNVVASMRPDVLVMDTVPQGSFGELLQLRAFCRRTVFVNRHKSEAAAADPVHQAHLPLYDLILTPDVADQAHRYVLPPSLSARNVFTGVVHGFRPEEAPTRQQVRDYFGVAAGQTVVYLSAGGGGDRHAQAELARLVSEASADPAHFVLVGYGPLYRGEKRYAPNVVPLAEADVRRFFPGVDLAVSAAGYNAYQELLAAGVPTAFYAQVKGMDRQDERVAIGVARGWHRHLEDFDPLTIRDEIAALKDPAVRAGLARALRERGRTDGALAAAVELLRLHASIPSSPVDERALLAAAAMRAEWTDVAREMSVGPAESRAAFVRAARRVLAWYAQLSSAVERNAFFDGARAALRGDAPPDAYRAAAAAGRALDAWKSAAGCPDRRLERLTRAYLADHANPRGLDAAGAAERFIRFCTSHLEPAPETR